MRSTYKGTKEAEDAWQRGASRALNRVAERLLTIMRDVTPLDEATLRASGHVEHEATPTHLEAQITFATPYAAYQHEGRRADGSHKVRHYSHAGTGTKYVERPLKEHGAKMIVAEIKDELGL